MGAPTSDSSRVTWRRPSPRTQMVWVFGLGVGIAVNRVSGLDRLYPTVILGTTLVALAIGAVFLLRRVDEETSSLRRHAPNTLLTVAVPVVALSATGVGGDNAMLVAATLVAVSALVTPPADRAQVIIRLYGVVAAATGVMVVSLVLRDPWDPTVLTSVQMLYAAVAVIGGSVCVVMRHGIVEWAREWLSPVARRNLASVELSLSLMVILLMVPSSLRSLTSPGGLSAVLLGTGLAVVGLWSSLGVLVTSRHRDRIAEQWRELLRPRGPHEPQLAYDELVRHVAGLLVDVLRRVIRFQAGLDTFFGRALAAHLAERDRASRPATRPPVRNRSWSAG